MRFSTPLVSGLEFEICYIVFNGGYDYEILRQKSWRNENMHKRSKASRLGTVALLLINLE